MRRRFVVNVKKRYGHLSVVVTLLPLPLVETPVARPRRSGRCRQSADRRDKLVNNAPKAVNALDGCTYLQRVGYRPRFHPLSTPSFVID